MYTEYDGEIIIKSRPLLIFFINTVVFFGIYIILGMFFADTIGDALCMTIAVSISTILSAVAIKDEIKDCFKRLEFKQFIVWVVGGYLLFFIVEPFVIAPIIEHVFNLQPETTNNELVTQITSTSPIIYFIAFSFLMPIREELVYRYSLIGTGDSFLILRVLFSSGLFAYMHLAGGPMIYGVYYLFFALILAFIYEHSDGNILYPIALHIVNNFIALLIS
ncbi:MAG: hypothetical protein BEN18_04335 [Epulopiscium sp. Nuni2H_MBin001]|nr:MAG: hypothetical protein BEN18_04335 [Epulopiscium sp. Nuni2H_MBin001]